MAPSSTGQSPPTPADGPRRGSPPRSPRKPVPASGQQRLGEQARWAAHRRTRRQADQAQLAGRQQPRFGQDPRARATPLVPPGGVVPNADSRGEHPRTLTGPRIVSRKSSIGPLPQRDARDDRGGAVVAAAAVVDQPDR